MFRCQEQERSPLTFLVLLKHCLASLPSCKHRKSGRIFDMKRSGSLDSWVSVGMANSLGLKKSEDSQGETNSIVKIKVKPELHFCMQNWWWYQLAARVYKQEPPQTSVWSLICGADAPPRIFPNLDSRLLLARDFPTLFNSGCRLAQFCDVYTLLLLSVVSISCLLMTAYRNHVK